MMTTKIAIAGLGVVGQEVLKYLASNQENLAEKHGVKLEVVAVSAHNPNKSRQIDLSNYKWYDSPVDMLKQEKPDIMVELIGGSEGVAYDIATTAIKQKTNLVTANKALLAVHGNELAENAEKAGITIAYEAAVCAEIPIIKELRKKRQKGINITMIQGILNGTCNFILSQMAQHNMPFDDALHLAQQSGYAEQDPSFDVDGIDSAHKLALLASLAFGIKLDLNNVQCQGIRNIAEAKKGDKLIKLIATAENNNGKITASVQPIELSVNNNFFTVDGTKNAIIYRIGNEISDMATGQGAGGIATSKAVIADIVDLAEGNHYPLFAVPYRELK